MLPIFKLEKKTMSKTKIAIGVLIFLATLYLVLGGSTLLSVMSQNGDLYLLIPPVAIIIGLVIAYIWNQFLKSKSDQSKDKQ